MPVGAVAGSLVGGGIGALGSYYGGKAQAKGYEQAAQMFKPYNDAGTGAVTTLAKLYGTSGGQAFSPESISAFRNIPGYRFARSEGLRGVDFADSARGTLLSSNNLRNRQQLGTNLADQTFQGSYVQPLLQMAGIGAQGAQGMASARIGQGTAQGGALVGMGNSINQGLAGAGSAIGQYNNNQTLMGMFNQGAYGSPTMSTSDFYRQYNQAPYSYYGGQGGIGHA